MSNEPKRTGPTSTASMSADIARARRISRMWLVAVVIPAVLTAGAVIAQFLLVPTLPDPVAIHWGPGGQPDGFAPAWTVVVLTVGAGLVVPVAIGLGLLRGLRQGDHGPVYRFLGALAAGLSALFAILATWSLMLQRGLSDAGNAPPVTSAVVSAFVVALIVGGVAWLLQPGGATEPVAAARAQPLRLAPGEDAVWLQTTSMGGVFAWITTLTTAALLLGTIAAWVLPVDRVTAWILTGTLVLAVLLTAATGAFRVRADQHGLTVTSLLGRARLRAPLAEIESLGVIDVNPVGEFGGMGLRRVPGRVGVVMRAGEAIQVTRREAPELVVTVDDAATAVAVLSAYLQRVEGGG